MKAPVLYGTAFFGVRLRSCRFSVVCPARSLRPLPSVPRRLALVGPARSLPRPLRGGRPLFLIHLLPHCHSERSGPISSSPFAPAKGSACGREEALLGFAFVGPAFLGGPLAQSGGTPRFYAFPQRPVFTRSGCLCVIFFLFSPLATHHSFTPSEAEGPLLSPPEPLLP
jgi:hypothetical protein